MQVVSAGYQCKLRKFFLALGTCIFSKGHSRAGSWVFTIGVIIFLASPLISYAKMYDLPQVTVLAASSISGPLTDIIRIYSKKNNTIVIASFDGTAEQARKIEQGEQADIFISSHPVWMSALKQKGLLDVYSLTNLARNKLALVVSAQSNLNVSRINDADFTRKLQYLNKRTIMTMGNFDDSALGLYTKQAIQNTDKRNGTKLWQSLYRKVIPAASAKQALYLISHGETAGITYYSDAYKNKEVNIVSIIDDTLHDPIIYQAAVVAGENMSPARDFLHFLQSEEAKKIYTQYGFIVD